MKNILIRNVDEADIPYVVNIQVSGWKTAYRGIIDDKYLDSLNVEEKIEKRKQDFNKNGFIVAEINGEVVGFCRFADNGNFTPEIKDIDCELLAIYIKPELKNNGIGRKLFEYVINEFKNKKKTKMIIWCLKDNEPSKRFYERMGGTIGAEKSRNIGGKDYMEVGFIYNL